MIPINVKPVLVDQNLLGSVLLQTYVDNFNALMKPHAAIKDHAMLIQELVIADSALLEKIVL